MDNEALIQRLMETFLDELEELVGAMNEDLLALEKGPVEAERKERLKTLFRTAHSLKGAARSVDQGALEATCHVLEELLAPAREGNVALESEHLEVIFAAADALGAAGHQLRAGEELDEAPLAAVAERLQELCDGGGSPATASPLPDADAPEPDTVEDAQGAPAAPTDDPDANKQMDVARDLDGGTVRVAASKLNSLLAQAGELRLIVSRFDARGESLNNVLEELSEWQVEGSDLGGFSGNGAVTATAWDRTQENLSWLGRELSHLLASLNSDRRVLDQALVRLSDQVSEARMLPFSLACQGIERTVRDLASADGKLVKLEIVGQSVELDRSIMEALKAPLLHLVRNAVSHGIEPPGERQKTGKAAEGRITIIASLIGSTVEVAVEDDGRGLDLDAIRSKAAKLGVEQMDDANLRSLIFEPGFSTAKMITEVSGRGVGLDVVAGAMENLRGSVDVAFNEARGTRFTMTLPLTLTTLKTLLVVMNNQVLAVPSAGVKRVLRVDRNEVRSVEGRNVLLIESAPVVFAPLAQPLGISDAFPATQDKWSVIILTDGRRNAAFAVDELLEERDVLIKSLGSRLQGLPNVAGATILPSGQPAIIVNPSELVRMSGQRTAIRVAGQGDSDEEAVKTKVLVVDDSITARSMLKSVLEGSGFEVVDAVDGADGWRLVEEWVPDIVVPPGHLRRFFRHPWTPCLDSSSF